MSLTKMMDRYFSKKYIEIVSKAIRGRFYMDILTEETRYKGKEIVSISVRDANRKDNKFVRIVSYDKCNALENLLMFYPTNYKSMIKICKNICSGLEGDEVFW